MLSACYVLGPAPSTFLELSVSEDSFLKAGVVLDNLLKLGERLSKIKKLLRKRQRKSSMDPLLCHKYPKT
jgi:hypothetical protein